MSSFLNRLIGGVIGKSPRNKDKSKENFQTLSKCPGSVRMTRSASMMDANSDQYMLDDSKLAFAPEMRLT